MARNVKKNCVCRRVCRHTCRHYLSIFLAAIIPLLTIDQITSTNSGKFFNDLLSLVLPYAGLAPIIVPSLRMSKMCTKKCFVMKKPAEQISNLRT